MSLVDESAYPGEAERLRSSCRACLQNRGVFNIFDENLNIHHKLQVCTPIQVDKCDGLPHSLCEECVRSLDYAYIFHKKCVESEKKLQAVFCVSVQPVVEVKCEITEEVVADARVWMSAERTDEEESRTDVLSTLKSIRVRTTLKGKCNRRTARVKKKVPTDTIKVKRRKGEKLKKETAAEAKYKKRTKRNIVKESNKDNNFNDGADLNDNEPCSLPIELQTCAICGIFIPDVRIREVHVQEHKEETFNCDRCKKTFKGTIRIELHKKSHANEDERFSCELCGKSFKRYKLAKHFKLVHVKNEVECEICHKMLRNAEALRQHYKMHNRCRDLSECNYCGNKYIGKTGLRNHIQRVHSDHRPHVCAYCGRGFVTSQDRKEHERLHTGERPHKCPLCVKGFAQLSNMKSHFHHNHKEHDYKEALQAYRAANTDISN